MQDGIRIVAQDTLKGNVVTLAMDYELLVDYSLDSVRMMQLKSWLSRKECGKTYCSLVQVLLGNECGWMW